MSKIAELKARLEAAKNVNNKASPELLEEADLAAQIDAEHDRADRELLERLTAQAQIALVEAREEKGPSFPLTAVVSIEAHKICGLGWLVLGPGDVGYAIQALKRTGTFDPTANLLQGAANDIDIITANVSTSIVRAPVKKDNYSDDLTKVPPFARICFIHVEQLRGAGVIEVEGKSAR